MSSKKEIEVLKSDPKVSKTGKRDGDTTGGGGAGAGGAGAGNTTPAKKITLNVSFYNARTDKKRLEHCVTVGDAECFKKADQLSKTTLKNIRQLLISKKVLTLSKYGSSFCTPKGAKIGDETLFEDYTDLAGLAPVEPEEDDEAELTEEEKKAKFTVYEVYILDNRKFDEGIVNTKHNLDLAKNKPTLLKMDGIDHLKSEYDPSKVVAKSGGDLPNPATMSQTDWHAVTRNNSLMHGHRLVFTAGGRDVNGKELPVRFRRIERAPYTAFQIKPREFELHEVSNDVTKDADSDSDSDSEATVFLRIPRFVVQDDSYVNVFETKTAVETSMMESSFSQTEVEASVEGGAFGYSAGLSVGFSQNQSDAIAQEESTEKRKMNITYNFPRVVLHLDSNSIGLTRECKADLEEIVKSRSASKLVDFHHRYGHTFATRVELGGRLFASETYDLLGTKDQKEAAKAMKVSASAAFSGWSVSASASASHETQARSGSSETNKSLTATINWQAQGGNTLLCNNPPEWVPTVAPFTNWRVIKQEEAMPLGQFIGGIKGYDYVPSLFHSITKESTTSNFVDFQLGPAANWKGVDDMENMENISAIYEAGPLPLVNGITDALVALRSSAKVGEVNSATANLESLGFKIGSLKLVESDVLLQQKTRPECTLQLEIEANLGEEAKPHYYKLYRIFIKELKGYLSAQMASGESWEYTTLCLTSDKTKASFFRIGDLDTSYRKPKAINNSDCGYVHVFSSSKEPLGCLSTVKKDRAILFDITTDLRKDEPAHIPVLWEFSFWAQSGGQK